MFEPNAEYHVKDMGRILLQVQDNLRTLRQTLTSTETPSHVANALEAVLSQAETDLRTKAEIVLNSTIQGQVHTLPSLPSAVRREPGSPSSREQLDDVGRPGSIRPTKPPGSAGARLTTAPTPQPARGGLMSSADRDYWRERLGMTSPAAGGPQQDSDGEMAPPVRGKPRRKPRTGKVVKSKNLLPSINRRDPGAPPPPITAQDANEGILSLIERGLLPRDTDVTSVFDASGSIVQRRVRLHEAEAKFVPTSVYTSPFGFNPSAIKLDLNPPPPPLPRPVLDTQHALAPATQTLTFEGPSVPGRRPPRGQPRPSSPIAPPEAPPQAPTEAEELRMAVDKIRGYNELLDEFSLHQFIIRRGRVLDSTPEFSSFKRTNAALWGPITIIISALERLLQQYAVPTAYIDGQAVATLAMDERAAAQPTVVQLLQCIANIDQVAPLLRIPGQRFKGDAGRESAATTIQATYRMHRTRAAYNGKQSWVAAARTIQHAWNGYWTAKCTRQRLREAQLRAESDWAAMMAAFKTRWPDMHTRRRVIVHVPSISAEEPVRWRTPHFSARQNLQMARLCAIADPSVEVVYIAPFAIPDDLKSYYQKLLQIGGVDDVSSRFKIVVPENLSRFPETMSLTSVLLYSPRALRRIQHYTRGKDAYIVPGVVGPEDKRLSIALKLPLLCGDPAVAGLVATKSGAKRLFMMADVNVPPGAHDLYNVSDLFAALTKLVAAHLHIKRWIIKIDDEFDGRGLAYIDVGGIKAVQTLRRQQDAMKTDEWNEPEFQASMLESLNKALTTAVPRRAVMVSPLLFRNWDEYAKAFSRLGGVVEAAAEDVRGNPSANLFISPVGQISVTSTHEKLLGQPFQVVGHSFPQQSVPYEAIVGASTAIGQALYRQGVMGYVSVEFCAFQDRPSGALRVWAIDLKPRLSGSACSFGLFNFLLDGEMDIRTGQYVVPRGRTVSGTSRSRSARPESSRSVPSRGATGEPLTVRDDASVASSSFVSGDGSVIPGFEIRSYVCHDYMFHPNLNTMQYGAFFNLCRLQGVSFDLQECVGTAFMLIDSLASGVLGILSVGRNPADALRVMVKCVDFIGQQVGVRAPLSEFDDEESNFQDITSGVKLRLKALTTKG